MGPPDHQAVVNRRVAEFKSPRGHRVSQEERRAAALAEQKKKRSERIDLTRNIDLLATFSIGSPSTKKAELPQVDDEDDDDMFIPNEGLAGFAAMLPPHDPVLPSEDQLPKSFGSTSLSHAKRKGKGKAKFKSKKTKKKFKTVDGLGDDEMEDDAVGPDGTLANAIMYAELLEMSSDLAEWTIRNGPAKPDSTLVEPKDGIPDDLENGWVALAPIPKGKRCMAVSYQAVYEGREEPGSRTLLHSRLKGKPFLTFPSPLPPNSILDCILDQNWQQNGILHVLDILRWRGSDFADCETEFRFWWRDAKLSELVKLPVPKGPNTPGTSETTSKPLALFSYPISFIAVPYYTPPLSFGIFLQKLIPAARSSRKIAVDVPLPRLQQARTRPKQKKRKSSGMEVDAPGSKVITEVEIALPESEAMELITPLANDKMQQPRSRAETAVIESDGILLYVSQASYQSGETPLASWIPHAPLDQVSVTPEVIRRSPLDIFEALIFRRSSLQNVS